MPVFAGENAILHLQDFIEKSSFQKLIILSDANVAKHCTGLLPGFLRNGIESGETAFWPIVTGESSKSPDFAVKLWKRFMEMAAGRSVTLINLGGGVVSDVGGFCAALYKRGIRFINIPTSLLSMVDASIGGKTAINLMQFKNQIGTITFPEAVFIDPVFLRSLPSAHLRSGFAESLKHALIADRGFWNQLVNSKTRGTSADEILQSAKIKIGIVNDDPSENGKRASLNLGHTIGHAFELFANDSSDNPVTHGDAVAIGILCETWISREKGYLSGPEFEEIRKVICENFPYIAIAEGDHEKIREGIVRDKKTGKDGVRLPLLTGIGKPVKFETVGVDRIMSSFGFYNEIRNGWKT